MPILFVPAVVFYGKGSTLGVRGMRPGTLLVSRSQVEYRKKRGRARPTERTNEIRNEMGV